jgi:hypothetical protein
MSNLAPLPENRCPRCGGAFHCGIDDAGPCACTGVRPDAALLARLRERYAGCLCLACLGALAQGAALDAAAPAPRATPLPRAGLPSS